MLEVVQLRRTALPISGTIYGFIVDFDHGLNAAVRNLRSVLGDSIESPGLHRDNSPPRLVADPEALVSGSKSGPGITSARSLRFAYSSVLPPDSGIPFQALRG
jgi:hypothetical protein